MTPQPHGSETSRCGRAQRNETLGAQGKLPRQSLLDPPADLRLAQRRCRSFRLLAKGGNAFDFAWFARVPCLGGRARGAEIGATSLLTGPHATAASTRRHVSPMQGPGVAANLIHLEGSASQGKRSRGEAIEGRQTVR